MGTLFLNPETLNCKTEFLSKVRKHIIFNIKLSTALPCVLPRYAVERYATNQAKKIGLAGFDSNNVGVAIKWFGWLCFCWLWFCLAQSRSSAWVAWGGGHVCTLFCKGHAKSIHKRAFCLVHEECLDGLGVSMSALGGACLRTFLPRACEKHSQKSFLPRA